MATMTIELKDQPMLADLISELESHGDFKDSLSYDILNMFINVAYTMPLVVDFDWTTWEEGPKLLSIPDVNWNEIDLLTKRKLITAILRKDRFCEGTLAYAIGSGLILRILKSI
jgi:hypothetical protein